MSDAPAAETPETAPRRYRLKETIAGYSVVVVGWLLLFAYFYSDGTRRAELRNTTGQTVYFTYAEHDESAPVEFTGVLFPNQTARLRVRMLDRLTFWNDDAGRYVVPVNDSSVIYRIEIGSRDEITVREFKRWETMP